MKHLRLIFVSGFVACVLTLFLFSDSSKTGRELSKEYEYLGERFSNEKEEFLNEAEERNKYFFNCLGIPKPTKFLNI